jgi:hypothetical protein
VLYNFALYSAAVIPALLIPGVPYPREAISIPHFLSENLKYFIDCLPILGLQYLISLQFKNFTVPVGVGFMLWVTGIGMLSWNYCFIFPYVYPALDHMINIGQISAQRFPVNLQVMSLIYFVIFIAAGYILYAAKKEKG